MFIFSNLAISLDGKIATSGRSFCPLGTPQDRKQMQVLRSQCDALLVGASTFRSYRKPSRASKNSDQPINIILSSKLENISPHWEFFRDNKLRRILFAGYEAKPALIKKFSTTSEVISLKKPTPKNPVSLQIIQHLEKKGIQRLLVEGGGKVMWDFAHLNLIDEYHVTLTPKILGGSDSPTLVDGKGFAPQKILNLKLRQCRVIGNEIYLTYAKTLKRGSSSGNP